MEQELIWADQPEPWTPWDQDEELLHRIMTGQISPSKDEAPEAATSKASDIQSVA